MEASQNDPLIGVPQSLASQALPLDQSPSSSPFAPRDAPGNAPGEGAGPAMIPPSVPSSLPLAWRTLATASCLTALALIHAIATSPGAGHAPRGPRDPRVFQLSLEAIKQEAPGRGLLGLSSKLVSPNQKSKARHRTEGGEGEESESPWRWERRGKEPQCEGKRVLVVDLGAQFHTDLLYGVSEQNVFGRGTGVNGGFGVEKRSGGRTRALARLLQGEGGEGGNGSDENEGDGEKGEEKGEGGGVAEHWPSLEATWHDTWANALDVVFHSRMNTYPCRVDRAEDADLFYVPYYGSLDISRHVGKDALQRGRLGRELAQKLSELEAFKKFQGADHFVILGRPYWDFVSSLQDDPWGTDILRQPALAQTVAVTVETGFWLDTVMAAPYTTSFHPPNVAEMRKWRHFVESHERPWLFAFGGARRKNAAAFQSQIRRAGVIRDRVFWQCEASEQCRLLDCANPPRVCERDWRIFTQLYLSSNFCIHPHGDSCTRRAVLDSMLAGCIPVLLEECSVDWNYPWLLGKSSEYSVYVNSSLLKAPQRTEQPQVQENGVPELQVEEGEVLLEQVLGAIPEAQVRKMRRRILDMIPRITFGGTSRREGSIEAPDYLDAFDYLVEGLARKVQVAKEKLKKDR